MSVENNTFGAIIHQFNHLSFDTVDYAVFVLLLGVSLIIGIYFGVFGHGADNTEEYLLGGKRTKIIPIAFSLVASQLSAASIAAVPAEIYSFGITWVFNLASLFLIIPVLGWMFYNNNLSNCYEGEIKAVVWADVVQRATMIGSVALFCFLGAQKVG